MAKNAKNMAELNAYIAAQIQSVMDEHVSDVVKEEQSRQVHNVVYDRYKPNNGKPWVYERRGDEKGLSDTRNMMHEANVTGDGVELRVTNETMSDDGETDVAKLVAKGHNNGAGSYDYTSNRSGDADKYLEARDYMEAAMDELKRNSEVQETLKRGLRSRGIDVIG